MELYWLIPHAGHGVLLRLPFDLLRLAEDGS